MPQLPGNIISTQQVRRKPSIDDALRSLQMDLPDDFISYFGNAFEKSGPGGQMRVLETMLQLTAAKEQVQKASQRKSPIPTEEDVRDIDAFIESMISPGVSRGQGYAIFGDTDQMTPEEMLNATEFLGRPRGGGGFGSIGSLIDELPKEFRDRPSKKDEGRTEEEALRDLLELAGQAGAEYRKGDIFLDGKKIISDEDKATLAQAAKDRPAMRKMLRNTILSKALGLTTGTDSASLAKIEEKVTLPVRHGETEGREAKFTGTPAQYEVWKIGIKKDIEGINDFNKRMSDPEAWEEEQVVKMRDATVNSMFTGAVGSNEIAAVAKNYINQAFEENEPGAWWAGGDSKTKAAGRKAIGHALYEVQSFNNSYGFNRLYEVMADEAEKLVNERPGAGETLADALAQRTYKRVAEEYAKTVGEKSENLGKWIRTRKAPNYIVGMVRDKRGFKLKTNTEINQEREYYYGIMDGVVRTFASVALGQAAETIGEDAYATLGIEESPADMLTSAPSRALGPDETARTIDTLTGPRIPEPSPLQRGLKSLKETFRSRSLENPDWVPGAGVAERLRKNPRFRK